MARTILLLFSVITTLGFAQEKNDLLYRIYDSESWDECGYLNANGDTIVPFGDCFACFSDSLPYAILLEYDDQVPGFKTINAQGFEIFRVFPFDNGPDYIEDGMMRIIKDGKIGYATEDGEVIVEPIYEAAWPFENGKAQVSIHAKSVKDGEHSQWVDTDWFYIDKKGNRIGE